MGLIEMYGDSSGLSMVGSGAASPLPNNDGAACLFVIDYGAIGLLVPEGKGIRTFWTVDDMAGLFGTDVLIADPA